MRVTVHGGSPSTFSSNGRRMSMGKAYSAYRRGATFFANGKTVSLDRSYAQHFGESKLPMAYFTYGRFQPGHKGHKVVIDHMLTLGHKDDVYVYVSESLNGKRTKPCNYEEISKKPCENPLDTATKIKILRTQNPDVSAENIKPMKNPFQSLRLLDKYEKLTFVIGQDRVEGFTRMFTGNENVDVSGVPRPGGGISSTKIREAVLTDKLSFVREAMGLEDEKHNELVDIVVRKIQAAYVPVPSKPAQSKKRPRSQSEKKKLPNTRIRVKS